jgi:hypothetical protein
MDICWRLKASAGKGTFLVSDEDVFRVIQKKWSAHGAGYLISWIDGRLQLLHRWLLNAPKGKVIDHRNRDKRDNRRSNFRVGTQRENMMNTRSKIHGKIRGVWFQKQNKNWVAECRGIHLGVFSLKIDAAMRYDLELMKQIGQDAQFNFPCAFIGEMS